MVAASDQSFMTWTMCKQKRDDANLTCKILVINKI